MTTFKSPEEIAQIIFYELDKDSIKAIKEDALTAEDMVRYHHSVGRSIRNRFLLWDENNPYTKVDCLPNNQGVIDDPLFPDQVSHEILKRVWELVHNKT